MNKCHINGHNGQCKNEPTKYIFGIELCDNHYHILYNMNDNIVVKSEPKKITNIIKEI